MLECVLYVFSFNLRLLLRWREPFYFFTFCLVTSLPSLSSCMSIALWGTTSPPSSSSFSTCTPLQPAQLPSRRKRALASVWSAQGGSVCTQCLPSWANSSAAAVWAKPGALIVTNAPLQEQVRLQVSRFLWPQTFLPYLYGANITLHCIGWDI